MKYAIKAKQYYTIKDLENLSGIKAHTLRIWEKRYSVFKPQRTVTNIRYYTNIDLKKLLNINILLNMGERISNISKLNNDELFTKVGQLQIQDHQPLIEKLIEATITFDYDAFNSITNKYSKENGFEDTLEKLFYPLFKRIGLMWMTNVLNPAQEHFVSNILKQKLFAQIDYLPDTQRKKTDFLLFLPQNEQHEIGLLYSNYILKSKGIQSVYLGQNVPITDVLMASKALNPDYFLFFFVSKSSQSKANTVIKDLLDNTEGIRFLISGVVNEIENIDKDRIILLKSPQDLKKMVNKVRKN